MARHASSLPGVIEAVVVADAYSVVVRYAAVQSALPEMVSRLEQLSLQPIPSRNGAGPPAARNGHAASKSQVASSNVKTLAAIPEPPAQNGNGAKAAPLPPPAPQPAPETAANPDAEDHKHHIRIKHFIPGRIRLHIPRLQRRPHLANSFEQIVAQEPGVTRVETTVDGGYV